MDSDQPGASGFHPRVPAVDRAVTPGSLARNLKVSPLQFASNNRFLEKKAPEVSGLTSGDFNQAGVYFFFFFAAFFVAKSLTSLRDR